ncbi:MAG: hypothetical protein FWC66_08520 [Oscillospiraceae bacterium]|nr:hypothetical protein [Oscillospiraceae bacterium]
MRDKHSDMLRVGKVSSIDYEHCTVQVVFEDRHDIVSGDLHIVVPFTLKDHAYYMPDIDERVVCLFDPSAPTEGYIMGSCYADTRMPPIQNEDKRYLKFKDETLIEYDRDNHKITIHIPTEGDVSIEIVTASDINITTDKDINVLAEGDIDVKAEGKMSIHSVDAMTISSDKSISIDAPEVDISD